MEIETSFFVACNHCRYKDKCEWYGCGGCCNYKLYIKSKED